MLGKLLLNPTLIKCLFTKLKTSKACYIQGAYSKHTTHLRPRGLGVSKIKMILSERSCWDAKDQKKFKTASKISFLTRVMIFQNRNNCLQLQYIQNHQITIPIQNLLLYTF